MTMSEANATLREARRVLLEARVDDDAVGFGDPDRAPVFFRQRWVTVRQVKNAAGEAQRFLNGGGA